ncbi:aminoglycoside N3'-acetyltransferase [Natronobacterium gregoryi SP2]|uniref:Aminoglycoside N3'-acetyltransferase n=1 Tax=Natronobacterium gregoryi (strain ATCC 43098 / DSM 3393 / CCM 3738 / CIP 104747 / IAM 13177 / JCM 8860 / NBRC 102187 / NCIMB 2189 / SP2) TaxID=797304 RepID=L9Y1U3_NATGS|nr:aminoglycoside N3'-acetyltransferase [Natronobacterium gregoryi SP2]
MDLAIDDEDFPRCGVAFERDHADVVTTGSVGVGEARRLEQRPLVDFAVEWFESDRR